MGFEQVVLKSWRENLLFSVLVELTYRCNLDCFFCYNDLGLRGAPLATEQYYRFFADLRDMEVLNLTLSGGEPLAHPDFLRLGARARELGFVVRIKSNGHALRGEMARRVRDEIDPFVIEVSLHGATAEVHDRQTRVAGSFQRLLANLEEMQRLGLRVKINSTLTAWNEHQIEEMLDLAEALGMPLQFDPDVTPRDDGDREPLRVTASAAGVLRLFSAMAERAARRAGAEGALEAAAVAVAPAASATAANSAAPTGAAGTGRGARAVAPGAAVARGADDGLIPTPARKHCGAGSSGIAVDPYGNVYPCVQWRRPVGNLREQSIVEIWAASRGLREVRELTVKAKEMIDGYGSGGAYLSFCPGNAAVLTGDPLRIYPAAERRRELTEQWQRSEEKKKALLPVLLS
ncbi:MAG TPA: radical SAM protein [Thermoanaerobaculia bacterium]|nr:radical SAM protein [Thermoanaerobaculia bacterium]